MGDIHLSKKPLVEAIFEIKWDLGNQNTIPTDPNYQILLGRLFDRLKEAGFSFHQSLPTANIPEHIAAYIVQHQFRVGENMWPLVQLGPGIMSVNETSGYKWDKFGPMLKKNVSLFFEAHPDPQGPKVDTVLLRYINAVDIDYKKQNIIDFLNKNMSTYIKMPDSLFSDSRINKIPNGFSSQTSFPITTPKGYLSFKFATGQKGKDPAVIFELSVQAQKENVPNSADDFDKWIDNAHNIIETSFFKLIDGELRERFS